MNYYLRQIRAIFKDFPSSRFLNLLKKDLESPGKILEFHLHQMVDTLYFHCADVKGSTDVKYGQQLVGEPRGCITNNVVLFVSI